jgi:hypothetical protein
MDDEQESQNMFAVNMFKVDENEEETTYSEDEREYDRGGGYSDESSNMPTTTTSNSNTMSSSDNNQGIPRPKFKVGDRVNSPSLNPRVFHRIVNMAWSPIRKLWRYTLDGGELLSESDLEPDSDDSDTDGDDNNNSGSSSSTTTTSNSNTMSSSDNNQGTPRPKFNINDMVYIKAQRIAVKIIDRYLDETRNGNIIWMYRVEFDDGDTLTFRESYLMEVPANSGSTSSTTTTTTTTTSGGDGSSSRGSTRSSKKRRLKNEDEEKKKVSESSMNDKCPICLNNFNHIFEEKGKIFSTIKSVNEPDEIQEVVVLNCCGKLIHKECLEQYLASKLADDVTDVRCPLCNKLLVMNNNGLFFRIPEVILKLSKLKF